VAYFLMGVVSLGLGALLKRDDKQAELAD